MRWSYAPGVSAKEHSSQYPGDGPGSAHRPGSGARSGIVASRRVLVHGAKFNFEAVSVQAPGGRTLERQVVRHPGAVVILPVLETPGQGLRIVLIRNLRVALESELLELPAGTLEAGEDPAACAARELVEETGYQAATLTPLGRFYTTPGLTDELMHAFMARTLTHVGQDLEADESITVCPMPLPEVLGLIDRAELVDGKSVLSILLALRRGLLPS